MSGSPGLPSAQRPWPTVHQPGFAVPTEWSQVGFTYSWHSWVVALSLHLGEEKPFSGACVSVEEGGDSPTVTGIPAWRATWGSEAPG